MVFVWGVKVWSADFDKHYDPFAYVMMSLTTVPLAMVKRAPRPL
jgi:hypothetical protein